jgi:hypothetical protein
MRNILHYAIASAVLIGGVVSQNFNGTTNTPINGTTNATSNGTTNPTWNGTANASNNATANTAIPFFAVLPRKSTLRALLADLSDDTPVVLQWNTPGNAMFTFQWDFDANLYSEEWRTNRTIVFSNDVVANVSTKFEKGKCTTAPDASNWGKNLEGYFASMNIYEGNFSDPFDLSSWYSSGLSLWRDKASRNWIWLDAETGMTVYMQIWRPEWKKYIVLKLIPWSSFM